MDKDPLTAGSKPEVTITSVDSELFEELLEADQEAGEKISDLYNRLEIEITQYDGPDRKELIAKYLDVCHYIDFVFEFAMTEEHRKTEALGRAQYPFSYLNDQDTSWFGQKKAIDRRQNFAKFCYEQLGASGSIPEIWDNFNDEEFSGISNRIAQKRFDAENSFKARYTNLNRPFDLTSFVMNFDRIEDEARTAIL